MDPSSLVTLASDSPLEDDGVEPGPAGSTVVTTVTWIDRFGNIQLWLRPAALDAIGLAVGGTAQVMVEESAESRSSNDGRSPDATRWFAQVRRVRAFAELGEGEFGFVLDGSGRMALVLNRASAAHGVAISGTRHTVRISTSRADHPET